jgi:hypothetical protein
LKFPFLITFALSFPIILFASDKDNKPSAPVVIPLTGSGQATTSKLGNAYITRTGGQSFTTTNWVPPQLPAIPRATLGPQQSLGTAM